MFDHITIRVSDLDKTRKFYSNALAALGYRLTADQEYGGVKVIAFGKNRNETWFTTDRPVSGPLHLAWKAESKEQVDAFYEAAIKAGGKDNGKPGFRKEYHENYYGAFVFDPDGNNIEAVWGNS